MLNCLSCICIVRRACKLLAVHFTCLLLFYLHTIPLTRFTKYAKNYKKTHLFKKCLFFQFVKQFLNQMLICCF